MPIPIYDITLEQAHGDTNELGIEQIAFTNNPAVIIKGVAYKSQEEIKFSFADNLKHRITAPAMIPMSIYRRDEDDQGDGEKYEYYTRFSPEVIDQLHEKFMRDLQGKGNGKIQIKDAYNIDHEAKVVPAYVLEAWIVDEPTTDKAFTTYGIKVPKGTLMMTAQVTDKAYYHELVKNGSTGFSIEGFLGMKLKETYMKIFSNSERQSFTKIEKVNKWEQEVENATFTVGDKVTFKNEKGESMKVYDGEYELQDGRKILVDSEGKIALIKNKEVTNNTQYSMKEGEKFQIGDNWFIVKDGQPVPCDAEGNVMLNQDQPTDPPADPPKPVENEEDEPTDPPADPAPASEDEPTDDTLFEEKVKKIVEPMYNDLLRILAEVKSMIPEKVEPDPQTEMGASDKKSYSKTVEFLNQNPA